MSGPIERVRKLAEEARAEYDRMNFGGGEPNYPAWISDIEAVCQLAEQAQKQEREAA